MNHRISLIVILMLIIIAMPTLQARAATTFVVNSTGDEPDADSSDGACATKAGLCTLRAAIEQANATSGLDFIHFNVGGVGAQTIRPETELAPLVEVAIIDGTTQPGYAGSPLIEVDGRLIGDFTPSGTLSVGISLFADGCTVRGLSVHSFGQGIHTNFDYHLIELNYIGLAPDGITAPGNETGLDFDSNGSVIGSPVGRNVISGNVTGIRLGGDSNVVQGNYIGTDAFGTIPLGAGFGIAIHSSYNQIGGTGKGQGNVISANIYGGIAIAGTSAEVARSNVVEGNFIGTDAAGSTPLGNGIAGVLIQANADNNRIGGLETESRNVISGNEGAGVYIEAIDASRVPEANLVQGNYIGTDASGTAAVPNNTGVIISLSSQNTIGAGNLISGNSEFGVLITSGVASLPASGNRIIGNTVGMDASGIVPLPNGIAGVRLEGHARYNSVGGTPDPEHNTISGNTGDGVQIDNFSIYFGGDGTATGNTVVGNNIGTNATHKRQLANGGNGVWINSGGNTVGGSTAPAGNWIQYNARNGIVLTGERATQNTIRRNTVYENGENGILITAGANGNIIGSSATTGNAIAGNGRNGVLLTATAGGSNRIRANAIFSNAVMGIDLRGDGMTPNDLGDLDSGPNTLQNFPVITSATRTVVRGTINTLPNRTIIIDVFLGITCDPSGNGEGAGYSGQVTVTTNASGNASFTYLPPSPFPLDRIVTVTATETFSANTSEFSRCVSVMP